MTIIKFAPAVCLQLLAHVMNIVNVPGLEKLRTEMGEWILSKEIRSCKFHTTRNLNTF